MSEKVVYRFEVIEILKNNLQPVTAVAAHNGNIFCQTFLKTGTIINLSQRIRNDQITKGANFCFQLGAGHLSRSRTLFRIAQRNRRGLRVAHTSRLKDKHLVGHGSIAEPCLFNFPRSLRRQGHFRPMHFRHQHAVFFQGAAL